MGKDVIKIKDIVSLLNQNPKIDDHEYSSSFFDDIHNEYFSEEDCIISINTGDKNIHGEEIIYDIEFDINVSWSVVKGGDGYLTPYYIDVDNVDIDVDLKNIIDYENDNNVKLNDMDSVKKIEKWVKNILKEV